MLVIGDSAGHLTDMDCQARARDDHPHRRDAAAAAASSPTASRRPPPDRTGCGPRPAQAGVRGGRRLRLEAHPASTSSARGGPTSRAVTERFDLLGSPPALAGGTREGELLLKMPRPSKLKRNKVVEVTGSSHKRTGHRRSRQHAAHRRRHPHRDRDVHPAAPSGPPGASRPRSATQTSPPTVVSASGVRAPASVTLRPRRRPVSGSRRTSRSGPSGSRETWTQTLLAEEAARADDVARLGLPQDGAAVAVDLRQRGGAGEREEPGRTRQDAGVLRHAELHVADAAAGARVDLAQARRR